MNASQPYYGSTKEKNKEEKIGGRTIIDIHSCLNVAFVFLWVVSICTRPTIVSTIHLLLFGIYVIIGGIILYETKTKNKTSPLRQSSAQFAKKNRKKKKYKVELADLSESLVSRTPPSHWKHTYTTFTSNKPQISPLSDQNISHPPVRYGVDSMIMIAIATYCSIVASLQVLIQILIAAGVMDGNSDALKMFGFQVPQERYEWVLYLTLDLILCLITIALAYAHKRRNDKYKWSRLNILNIQKVLLATSKSLPLIDVEHTHLSAISSDDDEDDIDIEASINSVSTQRTMLITGAKLPTLPIFYTFITSCLLLIISIAAPSILHIPYFLVVLLVCLGPIIALWTQTKPVFHLFGPVYMLLHLILTSIYQVDSIREAFPDTLANMLGLVDLHQQYWTYDELKSNQHLVPTAVATIFAIVLFYGLGLRPVLLHSSIYRATPRRQSLRQRASGSSARKSAANLFLSPPTSRKKARSIMLPQKTPSQKGAAYHSLPDMESDIISDLTSDSKENIGSNSQENIKKFVPQKADIIAVEEEQKDDDGPLEIINESATKIISDRRLSIMSTICCRLSAECYEQEAKSGHGDIKEEEFDNKQQKLDNKQQRIKERARAFSGISAVVSASKLRKKRSKTVDHIGTDSDTDSDDETMVRIERQETLKRLRSEHLTRRKLSTVSTQTSKSMSTKTSGQIVLNEEDNVFMSKVKWFLYCVERFIENMGDWFKWRFFLGGPLICQLVCLWACFPHQDAFFIIIMMWSYLSLFLLSSVQTRGFFKNGVVCILLYSICAAFIKYISYIPSLYDSNSSEWFAYFGMEDYGDWNGSYMFAACVPFLISAGYLEIQKLYQWISCGKIVTYLQTKNKSKKDRRRGIREMKKIAALYPQNFEMIMSKHGGTILHCCVDFRNADMVAIVAPYININARDMYGRTALSQARRIHKHSTDDTEIGQMDGIIAALWRVGCKRNKQMKWYSKFWQFLGMTMNYLAAAFYFMIGKFILFGVYVISTERADILHLIFLVFFLAFIVLGPLARKYWWTLILYNGIAITLRYIYNVFDIRPSDIVANEIGLRPPNDVTGLIYPAVLLSFVIMHSHLTRKQKERHTLLEFKFEQLILKNTESRTNSFLFAILYYLFYMVQDWCLLFVYIALIIIGLVQIHFIHMGYCVCVFFCFCFHSWFKDPWKKIRAYWILIVAYCTVCFFGLYASQYSFIHNWLKDDVYPKSFNDKYFSLDDIGLTNEDTDNEKPFAMFTTLLGPVIAMILTIIQFSYFVSIKPRQEIRSNYWVSKLSRVCCQLLYLGSIHCEKLTLLAAFIWCICSVNLISVAYVVIICIALINRITLRIAWCPFQIIAVLVFVLRYCYQFHYFEDTAVTNATVIGFERFGHSTDTNPVDASAAKIWHGLGQELTIIILATLQCVLQWWVRLKPKFGRIEHKKPVIVWKHERIYYEDLRRLHPQHQNSYTYINNNVDEDGNELLIQHDIELKVDEDFESGHESSSPSKLAGSMSHTALLSALRFTQITGKVVWRCLWRTLRRFWHVLTNIFYFYGVELSIIVMVFASFYRVYSFSLIYMLVTGCYIYDSRRNGEENYREWNVLRKIWWILCIFMTLWLLLQYWIVIPYELSDVIGECCGSRWWKLFHFNYDFTTSQYQRWWSWVAFIHYAATDLIFDFFVLLVVSLQRCSFIQHDKDKKVVNGQRPISSQLTLIKDMRSKSEADDNADMLWESIKLQCLIYSDKILLLLMFIFGIMNVDLLSIVFLLFPFFELFFSDSTNKQQLLYWWHYVQVYNYGVLILFTLYQLPAIPAENLDVPFLPWQNVVGVYKIYSNGNDYCYDEPCTNIFENSSIIHNIVLLIIIDLQIKILISKAYENSVIATYKEWILFSKYRCFHSSLMMKFKRLSQIDFFQNEKQIVQIQLEELFADKQLHESLAFSDEELTYFPRLEGELANKAQQEEELYKRNIAGQFSKRDPNLNAVASYNKHDIDLESSDEEQAVLHLQPEQKHEQDVEEKVEVKVDEEEEEEEKEEILFVPYEEGLCMLIDKDFYVINTLSPKERHCKIMEFFDGGNELAWHRHLRHLYKHIEDERFTAEFIIREEEIHETGFNDDGDEVHKRYIKQYTETVAIMLQMPMSARDFDTKANIPSDAVACVVILPKCSKFEALKFKIGVKLSNIWIWFRMFLITFVDASMYCNALDLMREITTIRKQLNIIDEKQLDEDTKCTSGDLRAYYESQKKSLRNVPQPNAQQLQYYASLQRHYKDKQRRKNKKREKQREKKQKEDKDKKKIVVGNKAPPHLSFQSTVSPSISPIKVGTEKPDAPKRRRKRESYYDRRRFSQLIHAKDSLQKQLSYITSHLIFEGGDKDADDSKDEEDKPECDNLLKMAVEIKSSTLDYLNSLNFASLFGAVLLSHTQEIAVLCFFATLFAHATVLDAIVPISFLIYGLLQLPRADQQFWLWIAAYTQIVMVLKFLYQLDIFCVAQYVDAGTQDTYYSYNIQPSFYCNNLNPGTIRFDQILGVTKSDDSNDAVSVLLADIVCLIFVAVHIMMLRKKGVWYETEQTYDNYIELWFAEYAKRQYMYKELEKQPAKNSYSNNSDKMKMDFVIIKSIGEPKRVYDANKDEFIENNIDYQSFEISQHRGEYVGIPSWDLWMFKFHALISKFLPYEIRKFFFELIPPSFRLFNSSNTTICDEIKPGIDLYFWMFIIDIVLLVWVLFFYPNMAEPISVEAAAGGFSTSRFSGDMVLVLFVQMMFMIFDRIVYLTNTLVLKLICQFSSVILFHFLIFVQWTSATNIFFYDNGFLVTYYLLRVIYWFLSCSQIAYGYPTFIRSHSRMSKNFTFFYYIFFTVYLAIPFVYEMRTILEWVCIPTTLQLIELMKVEDIYGYLFKIKCYIALYKEQRDRGEEIPIWRKFFTGGCVFIAIICFLIIPLLLFSTASPASTTNAVSSPALISISIINIQGFGNLDLFSLSNYKLQDVQVPIALRPYFDATSQISQSIQFESDADSIFTVPTVLRDRVSGILGCLNATNGHPLTPEQCAQQLHGTQIEMEYQFTRDGPDDNNPIQGQVYLNLMDLTREEAKQLSQVLNATNQNVTSFLCPSPYAQWLRLQAQNDVAVYNMASNPKRNVSLSLITKSEYGYESYFNIEPDLNFILISDNYVSSSLLSLTGVSSYSVVGFYAIVVYSFAQLLRLLYGDQVKEIIFQDLQNVDYILRIVTAVKLARNQRNYHLEELLYRKLIRIYRDPALIVTLSKRLKQEQTDSLAFDGIKDTSYNDPQNFGWGIRNRKATIMRGKSKDNIDVPPIQSSIKQE